MNARFLQTAQFTCVFPRRALQLVSTPSKLTPPFPQIFSQAPNDQGLLLGQLPAGCEFLSAPAAS